MFQYRRLYLNFLLCAIISSVCRLSAQEPAPVNEFRDWKSTKGTVINARLEGFKTKSIINLTKDDGKKIEVDRKSLSEEDGKYLDKIWSISNPIIIFGYSQNKLKYLASASNIRVESDYFNPDCSFLWMNHIKNQDFAIDAIAVRFEKWKSSESPAMLIYSGIHLAMQSKIKNEFFQGARRVLDKKGLESMKIVYIEPYIPPEGLNLRLREGAEPSRISADKIIQYVNEFEMELRKIPEIQFSPAARVDRTISNHINEWKSISIKSEIDVDFLRNMLMDATTVSTITRSKPNLVAYKMMLSDARTGGTSTSNILSSIDDDTLRKAEDFILKNVLECNP